ncbi:MAG: hypothetical protein AUH33_01680 [Chloroflexi bacterium 13_1_40CM_68_21]|nr:MAG: hypothetical protein AUH33_01680 [Chloroflexi bacterium 13_1_40CM_68_21]
MHSEATTKAFAHVSRKLVQLCPFSGRRPWFVDDHGEVDVAVGPALAARDAAKDVGLAYVQLGQPPAQEFPQFHLDSGLVSEQLVQRPIQHMKAVELIEIGTPGALDPGETDICQSAQHFGRAVMGNLGAPSYVTCADA